MLDIITIIAIIVAVALAAIVAYAATRPDTGRILRSVSIKAEPERVFPLINDLRQMNTWNPFVLNDPKVNGQYSGPTSGTGAAYDFQGPKSGTGRIEINTANAPSKIAMRLAMIKPLRCDNTVEFMLEPKGKSTVVTWAMSGRTSLMGKVMGVCFNMDKMVGKSFEEGLGNLKAIVERT